MKPTVKFTAICCCVALFSACKKDDSNSNNNNNSSLPTAQTLEAGKWQLSASTATVNYMGKDTVMDMYSQQDACKKDDVITFTDKGMVNVDEGSNICPGHGKTWSFTFALLNNDTKLALVDSNPDTVDVVEINNTQMKLKMVKPNSSGSPVTYLDTYKNIK